MQPLKNISDRTHYDLRVARWKARTDLGWLCREILDYKDVSNNGQGTAHDLHTPLINNLQQFRKPTQEQFDKNDILVNGKWEYTPLCDMLELEGKRRKLILDSRSFLKTTVNCISHSIQWILNYPDISMLLLMGSSDRATLVLNELKNHFKYNDKFRRLFPDYVPHKNIEDFGTADKLYIPKRGSLRKEPTIMTGSIEKGAASLHFHVIKFSDIVDENNVQGNGLSMVLEKFDVSLNLLISPEYWIDVEGTRYKFGDTYGKILDREEDRKQKGKEPNYDVFVRGCFIRDVPGGEKFTPEEQKRPFKRDAEGKRISRWPHRFSTEWLEDEAENNPWQFACQKLNSPAEGVDNTRTFPVNINFPKKIRRKDYEQNVRVAYKEICVDLAETANQRSNYTAIVVGAVAQDGKLYIEEIHWGRWLADQVCNVIFNVAMRHRHTLRHIKIEKTGYLRGLMPTIQRELDTKYRPRGIDFEILEITRSSGTKKEDRIGLSLQPWYKNDWLRFVVDMDEDDHQIITPAWTRLLRELQEFPASETDDILDALADFLSEKEYFGREQARPNPNLIIPKRNPQTHLIEDPSAVNQIFTRVQRNAFDKWLHIEEWVPGELSPEPEPFIDDYYKKFGVY